MERVFTLNEIRFYNEYVNTCIALLGVKDLKHIFIELFGNFDKDTVVGLYQKDFVHPKNDAYLQLEKAAHYKLMENINLTFDAECHIGVKLNAEYITFDYNHFRITINPAKDENTNASIVEFAADSQLKSSKHSRVISINASNVTISM
jgi:hypothetical protein